MKEAAKYPAQGFIFTEAKHTVMVYSVVSAAHMMTEAVLAANESGGLSARIPSSTASEPLPETGRISTSVVHSGGNPSFSASGAASCERASAAPDEENMVMTVISSMSMGHSPTAASIPSFAPSQNTETTSVFLMIPTVNAAATMINGIMSGLMKLHLPEI